MKSSLTFLLLLITEVALSQSFTQNGVIVKEPGDTLRGEISIPRSDKNPRYIDFTQGGTTTRYRPDRVKYFRIDDQPAYIGVITDIDKSPTKLKSDQQAVTQAPVRDSVFLMTVVVGKMNLYRLMDERSNLRFFISLDGKLTQLILQVKTVYSTTPGNTGIYDAAVEIYKNQLKTMITNCVQAEPWIDKTDYTQSSLTKLVLNYNSCHKEIPSYIQKRPAPRLVVGVFGGMVFSSLNNKGGPATGAPAATYSGSTKGSGGLCLEILTARTQQRLSVINEFMSYGVEFRSKGTAAFDSYYYDLKYVRYNLAGRYYFSGNKLVPYVQAGVGIGRAYQRSYFSGLPANQRFIPGKNDKGVHLAAGLKVKRFGIQARYERSPGFSESRGFISKVNNIFAFVTFDLNKPKDY
jgi:hypothetical protein